MLRILILSLLVLSYSCSDKRVIWNEVISLTDIKSNAIKFNFWMNQNIKNNPFELKVDTEGKYSVIVTRDLEGNDNVVEVKSDILISSDKIYLSEKYAEFIKELEQKYGYDEITYFAIFIISEYFNPNSEYRAYLDIIPKKPSTPTYNYWDIANQIEPEILGSSIIRKLVDYKIQTEQRARNVVHGLLSQHPDLFNPDIFNEENMQWAYNLYDASIHYVESKSLLIPFIDFMSFSAENEIGSFEKEVIVNKEEPLKYTLKVKLSGYKRILNGSEVKRNPKLNGDVLMTYYGLALDNNEDNDCLSLGLSFSERKDDKLISERIKFFGKFFLYDRNHYDLIEECLKVSIFSSRILFYYYTLMMDETDLKKLDPNRVNLHEDKIIVEFTRHNMDAMDKLNKYTLAEEEENYEKNTTSPLLKQLIKYKIQQRKLLKKYLDKLKDQFLFLLKDEAL